MTPMSQLVISMVADVSRLQRDMNSARTTVDGAMVKIQRSTAMATRALAGFIGAFSVTKLAQISDQFKTLNAVLGIATGSLENGHKAFADVLKIALQTGQALDNVGQIYRRFAENAKVLGITQSEVSEATKTVAQSLALSSSLHALLN